MNSLRTIRRRIRTTYQALAVAKRIIERNVGEAALQKAVEDILKDSPNAKDTLARIRIAGGPTRVLESLLVFLRPRYDRYSTSIAKAAEYFDSDGNRTLAEMALAVGRDLPAAGNDQPSTTIAFEICWNLLSCFVSLVIVGGTLLGAVLSTSDGEDDGEGEPGDFPQPDPDGPQPA